MPNWPFSDHHQELREQIRSFVEREIAPQVDDWEAKGDFPDDVFTRMGELGLLGLSYPEEYGGGGGDYLCNIVLAEEMSRCGHGSVPMAVAVQTDMAVPPVFKFGTEEQKKRYLVPAIRGEKIFCLGITEPGAGSDVQNIATTAEKVDGGWIVNGRKTFITNGRRAHVMTLVAKTGKDAGHQGLSLFIVDTDTPGYRVEGTLDKVGMLASDTAEISFTDMFIPDGALLGKEGEGFYNISWELQGERLIGAAGTIAGARRMFEAALAYAQERRTFGKPIGKHQVIRHALAEMATQIAATEQLIHHAAYKVSVGEYPVREISMAKLQAGLVAWEVADKTVQIFGGYGYSMEFPAQRGWRDTRLVRIGGGTDEVMREIIGRTELGGAAPDPNPGGLFRPEHEELRSSISAWVARELAPNAQTWERDGSFPREVVRRAGELGYLGMKYPEEVGGSGPDLLADAVVTEELTGIGSGGVAASLGAHKDLGCLYLYNFGNAEQHQRWLRPAVEGHKIAALGVTEPDAGSDVAGIRTSARRDGSDWILNGTKTFITNGAWADFVVVAARTGQDPHGGLTLFVVEAGTPGFESRRLQMLGWRPSYTGELSFSDVRIPDENRLGEEGGAFYAIMQNFAWERLVMALAQAAGARRTLELAMAYSQDRSVFDRPVSSFQVWRHRFADLATRIEAGRALTYGALRKVLAGDSAIADVAMAKLFTSEVFFQTADECVQVHGGYGYMTEYPAQRAWRDARLGPIGGGTSEIMREIIGKTLGL